MFRLSSTVTFSLYVRIKSNSLFKRTAGGCLLRSSPGLSGRVTPAELTCTNLPNEATSEVWFFHNSFEKLISQLIYPLCSTNANYLCRIVWSLYFENTRVTFMMKTWYLGVIGSLMYARMLENGSWNDPSSKVGLSFPSYSNLLYMSCIRLQDRFRGVYYNKNESERA